MAICIRNEERCQELLKKYNISHAFFHAPLDDASDIKIAVENNCDSYVTGEYNLYSQQYAKIAGINLLVGSHTNTEILGVCQMVNHLIADTDIKAIQLFEENY